MLNFAFSATPAWETKPSRDARQDWYEKEWDAQIVCAMASDSLKHPNLVALNRFKSRCVPGISFLQLYAERSTTFENNAKNFRVCRNRILWI